MGSCGKCGFTGELDDADYRTCGKNPDGYKKDFSEEGLQQLLSASSVGKGIAQSLLKRISDDDPFGSTLAKLHLGILCQCLRQRVMPGTIARYYLRIAWLFRDHETYYAEADPGALAEKIGKLRKRWKRELPEHDDYPAQPDLALEEAEALTLCQSFFERNYETLKQAGQEDELRLRLLLAEIGFRLYELTNSESDYKRAASFFSGTMQQCLSIVSDKTIVGGIVNRAREMLETSGERGRELRALHKSRGGTDDNGDSETPKAAKKKKKVRKGDAPMKDSASAKDATAARGKGKKEKSAPVGPNGKGNGAEAIATPKPADEDIEEGTQAERDKATRQMSLLKEEVETLKERVKDLEDDNKKWRQLIGRDALTGLPNKVTLFRIELPKILRTLSEPYTCIAIGLDQVAKVNLEHGWLMGDRMLKASAKGLQKFLQEGDQLYRIDGSNFVITGKMDGNAARQRATDMRRSLGTLTVQVENTTLPLASSLGVVTVEQKATKSDAEIAASVYQALITTLYKAKEKGGNTAEVHNITRF